MSDDEKEIKLVDEALEKLSEHFDGVQIFVNRHETNDVGTGSISRGLGNWYSRYGHVKAWVLKQDERERISVRKEEES